MLISRKDGKLLLVEQNEHGRLAGEICSHWGNEGFQRPDRHEHARIAADIHDEGWRQADDAPMLNEGEARPLHFLEIDMADHLPLYRRGVEAAFERDPYAGLLVSMHWTGLYRARWGMQSGRVLRPPGTPEVQKAQDEAIAGEERRWIDVKAELMTEARRSDLEAGLWHNFDLLQAWDLLSLYMCLADTTPTPQDEEPVSLAPLLKKIDQTPGARMIESVPRHVAGERGDLVLRAVADRVATIDPYPFDEDAILFTAQATAIEDRRYESEEDARAAIDAGDEVTLSCEIRRP
jgi:hypothetical protein